jgi:hypothetical protein
MRTGEQLHQRLSLEHLTMLAELHEWLGTSGASTRDAIHATMAAAVAGMKGVAPDAGAGAHDAAGGTAAIVSETLGASHAIDSARAAGVALRSRHDGAAFAAALVGMDAVEAGRLAG